VGNTWIPGKILPSTHEWEACDQLAHQEGLLHGFFTETDGDGGSSVVGLVEHPDGTFDTYVAQTLKFETPTQQEYGETNA
jgi:hypothetical protein